MKYISTRGHDKELSFEDVFCLPSMANFILAKIIILNQGLLVFFFVLSVLSEDSNQNFLTEVAKACDFCLKPCSYSVIDKSGSVSKLTIENFKVTKAPAFATLLTLADLGGIADLLSGDGMSFDILEINLKEDKNTQTIEEILALGPSVSLQLDGYIEKKTGLVSLSGTMVPAKMLNNLISKIPVVGDILVGEKAGEGVFGVSFKMKGLPGEIKTIVNPVKTLTPRFITRALEKRKKEKSK